jgi:preprotein translocase subunit SecA
VNEIVVQGSQEYVAFLEELKAMITEGEFNARWTLLETYHEVGKFISESQCDYDVDQVAKDIEVSELTLKRAIKFYEKYPDMNLLPEGKAISWHKVVNDLLPEVKREPKELKEKEKKTCPNCGFKF